MDNYRRFYQSFKSLPWSGDVDDLKRSIVSQWTGGRTESLREMSPSEYDECCKALEQISGNRERLRKQRSACLKLMQRLCIDTTDWNRVNAFCRDPRIAGKEFFRIRVDELEQLQKKLRAMLRKGGLRMTERREESPKGGSVSCMVLPLGDVPMA